MIVALSGQRAQQALMVGPRVPRALPDQLAHKGKVSQSRELLPQLAICLLLAMPPVILILSLLMGIFIHGLVQIGLMLARLLDLQEVPGLQVISDPRDRKAFRAITGPLAHKAFKAFKANKEYKELQGPPEVKAQSVLRGLQVVLALQALSDLRVRQAVKARLEPPDPQGVKAFREMLDPQGPPEVKAHKEILDPRALPDLRAQIPL